MGKSKRNGSVARMSLSLSHCFRTRAKTLAFKQSRKLHASAAYLQLRRRRLQKPPVRLCRRKATPADVLTRNHSLKAPDQLLLSDDQGVDDQNLEEEPPISAIKQEEVPEESRGLVAETETGNRSTRESTPCSLLRDPEAIATPVSDTRPTCSTDAVTRMPGRTPSDREMDEFFAGAEKEQVRRFIDKYNFDPVNDKPLPCGRFEWEKLDT
ncbi:Cyclin-dependent kinase inhibitor 4 [Linum perenne]